MIKQQISDLLMAKSSVIQLKIGRKWAEKKGPGGHSS
jgi:hypothetical protein